ncbi:MAG: DUF3244 domain-containing protein [Clostridiales bacterium]|jgi:hypothetical protein|nr:DUF3244 domain-containing protein [Clostridiales bacterium]
MKNYLLALTLCIAGLFSSLSAYSTIYSITTRGTWGGTKFRTLPPAPPSASIEDNALSLYFPSALSNLTVTVSDADGSIVYQVCISSGSGSTYTIPFVFSPGEYQLTLTNSCGTLSGYFEI